MFIFFSQNCTDYLNLNDWHHAFNVKAYIHTFSRATIIFLTNLPLFCSVLAYACFVHLVATEGLSERVMMKPGNDRKL